MKRKSKKSGMTYDFGGGKRPENGFDDDDAE